MGGSLISRPTLTPTPKLPVSGCQFPIKTTARSNGAKLYSIITLSNYHILYSLYFNYHIS
jgi:hypothetical protein